MFTVVITGPPSAGKTSVLTALADALSDDNVPHAAVEAEALRWAHPAITGEQEMRHLGAMCTLYRQAGHTLILIGQTIEVNDDLTGLLDAPAPTKPSSCALKRCQPRSSSASPGASPRAGRVSLLSSHTPKGSQRSRPAQAQLTWS